MDGQHTSLILAYFCFSAWRACRHFRISNDQISVDCRVDLPEYRYSLSAQCVICD